MSENGLSAEATCGFFRLITPDRNWGLRSRMEGRCNEKVCYLVEIKITFSFRFVYLIWKP